MASTSGAVAFMEGKERKQKLPIYDEPEPEMVVKEEPTRLDEVLRAARKETDRQILGMKYHLQMATNKVVDLEKEAEGNIKSVLVKEEEVMPAAIYVVVAGFAGSIFARRRNILLRFLSPVAFSALAFGYFFPSSSNRLIARANQSDLSKYIPQDLQKQLRELTGQVSSTGNQVVEEVKQTAKDAKKTVEKNEESVQERVQEKIQETVAAAKDTAEDVKEKVAELKKALIEETEKGKNKVEELVEKSDMEARQAKIRAEDSLKRV
ncbi:apolipo protein O-domain-containing protein [Gamsiella multidivaricata]|uniref:apolipo protein O-domain-containing protein n=1 Tax=Gamsiella multidivaricata TaxID=101098 RepID=UPI002220716B|nr:apolipo protein O-domain-containing protein [Gamsiella multidivaricata]KAI7816064.1 apolipo protein O-domain-containing protein [Gamsiella multidivaricata]